MCLDAKRMLLFTSACLKYPFNYYFTISLKIIHHHLSAQMYLNTKSMKIKKKKNPKVPTDMRLSSPHCPTNSVVSEILLPKNF